MAQKTLRYAGLILGILVLVIVIALITLVTLVNPNDFKEPLAKRVYSITGHTLTIKGDIQWTLFPWLGVQFREVDLSNTAGFGEKPFAHIQAADLQVKLLPLVIGRIELGNISLKGAQFNLIRNNKGIGNWQDFKKTDTNIEKNKTPPSSLQNMGFFGVKSLDISGITISDGQINWDNQQQNQKIKISALNFSTKNIHFGRKFPITLKFDFVSNQPQLQGNISLNSTIAYDLKRQTCQLDPFKITIILTDKNYSNGKLNLDMSANIAADLSQQTLLIHQLHTNLANLEAKGDLRGTQIIDAPVYDGQLNIPSFNLGRFLTAIGHPGINLATANATMQLKGTRNQWRIINLQGKIDESAVKGDFALDTSKGKKLNFGLIIDQVNIDRYTSTKKNDENYANASSETLLINNAQAASTKTSTTSTNLQTNGNLHIGRLKVGNMIFSAFSTQINANDSYIKLSPIKAQFYQGTYLGDITIDTKRNIPVISSNQSLQGIQIEPLMHDLSSVTRLQVSGTANINTKLTMQGSNRNAILNSLEGSGLFVVKNGFIKGINIPFYVELARTLLNKEAPLTSTTKANQTEFGNLTGTLAINHGVISNNDLLLQGPYLQAKGNGIVDLAKQHINYTITATTHSIAELKNAPIPIIINGPFDHVSIRPDMNAIAKYLLQQQLEKHGEKIKSKITEEIGRSLGKDIGEQIQKNIDLNSLFH